MLDSWIKGISPKELNITDENHNNLSAQTAFYDNISFDFTKAHLCILGIGSQSDSIRKCVYQYAEIGKKLKIIDLGNVKKKNFNSILPILKEIEDSGLKLLILDCEGIGPRLLFDYYNGKKEIFCPVIVDETLRSEESSFDLNFLNEKLYNCLEVLTVGSQIHLQDLTFSDNYQTKHLRLGKLRNNKETIEPFIRNGHFCYFNLNSIRKSDAPGKSGSNPSGLFSEEASQISRYAGLSNDLSIFMIGGFWHIENQTTQLISQMIWYFLEGFTKRSEDQINNNSELQQYIVDLKEPAMSLTFIKSEKSGRWWFKLLTRIDEKAIFKHIPCTYQDYQSACNEDISDLVLDAIESQ